MDKKLNNISEKAAEYLYNELTINKTNWEKEHHSVKDKFRTLAHEIDKFYKGE